MNTLRNKVQLIGHLGTKVELKTLESGKVVGHVTLATNETYKNQKGEKVTETTWHNLVIWASRRRRSPSTQTKVLKSGSKAKSPTTPTPTRMARSAT